MMEFNRMDLNIRNIRRWLFMLIVLAVILFLIYFILHFMYNYTYERNEEEKIQDYPTRRHIQQNDLVALLKGTNRSLTVVTAYFAIGSIPKGSIENIRTPENYSNWMRAFRLMKNPMIFYTDDKIFADHFITLRKNNSLFTEIVYINRSNLWAFQIIQKIREIYSSPGYPCFYPNTNSSEYTSMTHAKQEILARAIQSRKFGTDFYCWCDLGYFRDLDSLNLINDFWLEAPDDFDKSRIAVTRVYDHDLSKENARNIILKKLDWVGGGLFLGTPEVILKFHDQYKDAVKRYLGQGLINSEQQILYAMYTTQERQKHPIAIKLHLYIPGQRKVINDDPWFYLGYLMYRDIPK